MKALLSVDHSEALSELRNQIISEIETYIEKPSKIQFTSGTRFGTEEIYNENNNRYRYYGSRYKGYSDRYDCNISDLTTDDLSEILTALEELN